MTLALKLPLASLITFLGLSYACESYQDVTITFYGYPDNSPPGADIAYDCGRGYTAGGTGTYDDPLTMASAEGEWDQCTVLYVPYLKKYVRYEDYCGQCTSDWDNSGIRHIDIWTGSSTVNGGQDQINCEDDLTPDPQGVISDPSDSYEVDSTELYAGYGTCNTGDTYNGNPTSNYC